jgi:ATP-binding cassette subfamily F protein 3
MKSSRENINWFGFLREDFSRQTSEFSRLRMRIELLKFLKKPDLILLDEPTNHMDIESINAWLDDKFSQGGCGNFTR